MGIIVALLTFLRLRKQPKAFEPKKVEAFIAFCLSPEGQADAIFQNRDSNRQQIFKVTIEKTDLDVFSIDDEGYLLAATYSGALMGRRPIPRSPKLSRDLPLDFCPTNGHQIIAAIRLNLTDLTRSLV